MLKQKISRWLASILLSATITLPAFSQDLVVYTYDSFNTEWGPGPVVFKAFEEQCSCKVQVIAPGDSGSVMSRTILEKANPKADVLLGVNDSELAKSFKHDLWEPYRSPNLNRVPEELRLDPKHRVTPFDYGYIAFVYDSERLTSPPKSLADLT
ncbi:MAG: thiamine ABC transporter substrate-binding protein, partial [SAR324 cluster bacterium]|nr:thiamine ABC transporter substrate-binding protein [SAR324 cluster bacterium]